MRISIDDEAYERAMATYQLTEIARLNEVLARNGVADVATRRRICAQFADASGSFLDQGWLRTEADGERLWPFLGFSTRALDAQDGLGPADVVLLPEYASNFHEYAGGNVYQYFDEQSEQLGAVECGLV